MVAKSDTDITFLIGQNGDVEWFWKPERPDLTTEQAMVIAHVKGMRNIASAIENLAAAVEKLADRMPNPDEV